MNKLHTTDRRTKYSLVACFGLMVGCSGLRFVPTEDGFSVEFLAKEPVPEKCILHQDPEYRKTFWYWREQTKTNEPVYLIRTNVNNIESRLFRGWFKRSALWDSTRDTAFIQHSRTVVEEIQLGCCSTGLARTLVSRAS